MFILYYYNVIIAWCAYYFAASFSSTLPWTGCAIDDPERLAFYISQICKLAHMVIRCFDMTEFRACMDEEGVYLNHTCINSTTPAWEEVLSNHAHGFKQDICHYRC